MRPHLRRHNRPFRQAPRGLLGNEGAHNPIFNHLLLSLLWSARAAGYRLQPFVTCKEPGSRAPTSSSCGSSARSPAASWPTWPNDDERVAYLQEAQVPFVLVGRLVPRSTRLLTIAAVVLVVLSPGLPEGLLMWPRAQEEMSVWHWRVALLGVLALWGSGLVAQVYRYRRVSGPVERQQAKWVSSYLAASWP